ncbi:MAG: hypothetical protein AAF654_07750 [Myxococcota bacterium]
MPDVASNTPRGCTITAEALGDGNGYLEPRFSSGSPSELEDQRCSHRSEDYVLLTPIAGDANAPYKQPRYGHRLPMEITPLTRSFTFASLSAHARRSISLESKPPASSTARLVWGCVPPSLTTHDGGRAVTPWKPVLPSR